MITIQGAINQLNNYKKEFEGMPWATLFPEVSYHLCCAIEELEIMQNRGNDENGKI